MHPEFKRPPALCTGLPIFLVLFHLASYKFATVESLCLGRQDFLHPSLDLLNRLSFYSVVHLNWFHLLCNIISITPLLWDFETQVGTVRTGIILNVLSVFPGLSYGLVSLITQSDTKIVGASGWCFSFLAYGAWKMSLETPALPLGDYIKLPVKVPTWSYPIAVLLITTILLPFSSFTGHAIGLVFGYLLALGYLGFAIDGTPKVVRFIEAKIDPVIVFLSKIVVWVRENDVRPEEGGHVLGTV